LLFALLILVVGVMIANDFPGSKELPTNSTYQTHKFKLKDGRYMGYAIYGSQTGIPVVVMSDMPGSRYFNFDSLSSNITKELRIIALERAGYGLSDPTYTTSLISYMNDLTSLIDSLKLKKFHVVGIGAGGPYALGLGYKKSGSVSSITLIASLGAIHEMDNSFDGTENPFFKACAFLKNYPSIVPKIFFWFVRQFLYYFNYPITDAIKIMPESEQNALINKSVALESLLLSMKEGVRPGSYGMHFDHKLLWQFPWGFSLKDIRVPVKVYYSEKDTHIPISQSRYLCENLPSAKCHYNETDTGHYSFIISKLSILHKIVSEKD